MISNIQILYDIYKNYILVNGREIFIQYQEEVKKYTNYGQFVKMIIKNYIPSLMVFYQKMKEILVDCFENSLEFHKSMNEGFKGFINQPFVKDNTSTKIPQIFALYCDDIIRKKEIDLDEKLDKILNFIPYFNEKDIFIEEYRNQLSKRLLSGIPDLDEGMMIGKLKRSHSGIGDIYKLEKMIHDKSISQELKTKFSDYQIQNNQKLEYQMILHILTIEIWPITHKETLVPPSPLLHGQEMFTNFYNTLHSKKVLKWVYSMSSLQIETNLKSTNLIDCSFYQGSILLLFNDIDTISLNDLQNHFKISSSLLQQIIQSLTKSNLLLVSSDQISLNLNYEEKQKKVRLQAPRITEEETTKSQRIVDADRQMIIEATIIRVMKYEKKISEQDLIIKVIDQLQTFECDQKTIKSRFESLFEKEMIKEEDGMIVYIA